MAEMDSIIRDALKRNSQMQGSIPRPQQRQNVQRRTEEKAKNPSPEEKAHKESEENHKSAVFPEKKTGSFLDNLLKDKEQSLILLLVVLLMNENNDPSLLLALMYLLI